MLTMKPLKPRKSEMALQSVKKGKNFEVFTDGKQDLIRIDNVRVSFPAFGEKKEDENEDGTKRYSWQATPMLSKDTHVEAKDAFMEICRKLKEHNKGTDGKPVKIAPEYMCIKDGDTKERAEYEGHWIISSSESKRRPAVRNEHGQLMIDPERMHDPEYVSQAIAAIDDTFYGGCYISVMLRPWYFSGTAKGKTKTYPKRICCGLVGAKFVRKGEPFGSGRIDDTGAWGDDSSDAGDDGMDDDGL
jgi:Protein of unknown function (DUF2815)